LDKLPAREGLGEGGSSRVTVPVSGEKKSAATELKKKKGQKKNRGPLADVKRRESRTGKGRGQEPIILWEQKQ